MKLLVDCMPLRAGGGVQVAVALLEGLRKREDVEWIAVAPTSMKAFLPDIAWGGGKVVFLRKSSPLDFLRASIKLSRIERKFRPDLVFTVFGPTYFRSRAPHLMGFALPNLIYLRDGPLAHGVRHAWLADTVKRALIRRADHFVVETETVRSRLAQRIGFDPRKISVIGNSVNPLLLRHSPTALPDGASFGILVPSAYYRHKNMEIIPAVAAALSRAAPELNFQFRLTLNPQSKEWLAISHDAGERGVGSRVTTLGSLSLDHLAKAYQASSAVFLPTLREASTAVYPEAFYFRRPLVTSDMDFARELCGDAAIFVPPLNPGAIAVQLAKLSRDRELINHLVTKGEEQLKLQYPSTKEKFAQQMTLLATLAAKH